ncbi:MAG: beta-Ala-His dipeptidase [Candidatus Lokiarchaeota archaeon]|nr:beta-Ala-His dipeptidase [Candidatus Lokiarchaeota archaeon]MBD3202243.1 beta-Ala-His dipeptidase [Candidatus Lokiarchaeota archaeon]
MIKIENLSNPKEFWHYFIEISKIPRCSGNEQRIREYIKQESENLGFKTEIDKVGNLIVSIPSKSENTIPLIIQSHLDMVCEKNENIMHDFSVDPLKLREIKIDGERWITAEGTSLGADNGVGLANSLALMKKISSKELEFDNLDFTIVFTVNEEEGLFGAFQIENDILKKEYLINLDCMSDETFVIGCVGGFYTIVDIKLERIELAEINKDLIPVKIYIKGLAGGHSGLDINKGRGNAIKILAKILYKLNKEFEIYIDVIKGGDNFNAIPRESWATLFLNESKEKLTQYLDELELQINKRLETFNDNLEIIIEDLDKSQLSNKIIEPKLQQRILSTLYLLPHGPILIHPKLDNFLHSSTNFAIINTKTSRIKIQYLHRSFDKQISSEVTEKIKALLHLGGLKSKVKPAGGYGIWDPDFTSKLLKTSIKCYTELNCEEPKIRAMHAGLECGVFADKCPELEMITMGPNVEACHSPDERLQVKSVEKFWKIFISVLKELSKIKN